MGVSLNVAQLFSERLIAGLPKVGDYIYATLPQRKMFYSMSAPATTFDQRQVEANLEALIAASRPVSAIRSNTSLATGIAENTFGQPA